MPALSGEFRCIVPDLPLGSHAQPMHPDADLSPPALARLIADLVAALDLDDVTLVGNDTGGALCQLVVTRHPERIGRLVLTPCDAFENFPPPLFNFLLLAARVPPVLNALLQTMRVGVLARSPIGFGLLTKHRLEDAALQSYIRPSLSDAAVRRDLTKALRGLDPRHTLEAASKLGAFTKPALLAWAPEDRLFPIAHARRLAEILPDARVVEVQDAYTFVPEDQPDRLAELIADFVCSALRSALEYQSATVGNGETPNSQGWMPRNTPNRTSASTIRQVPSRSPTCSVLRPAAIAANGTLGGGDEALPAGTERTAATLVVGAGTEQREREERPEQQRGGEVAVHQQMRQRPQRDTPEERMPGDAQDRAHRSPGSSCCSPPTTVGLGVVRPTTTSRKATSTRTSAISRLPGSVAHSGTTGARR